VRIPNGRLALYSAALLAVALAPAAAQTPSYATNEETIRGTISALDGKYALTLADERGFSDSVTLHDGTLISPAGASLVPGALVVITGHADGSTFDADAVDTDPADAYETNPTPDSYGPSGGAAYPALLAPFAYGFGFGYYGFGYPNYPGVAGCCISPLGNSSGRSGSRPAVPVTGHAIPLPHPIRARDPVAPAAAPSSSHRR